MTVTQRRMSLSLAALITAVTYAVNALFNHTSFGAACKEISGVYTVVFFVLIGTGCSAAYLGWLAAHCAGPLRRLGVGLQWRDLIALVCALLAGGLFAFPSLRSTLAQAGGYALVLRLFCLLLVASIAEVLVFWGVLGNTVELVAVRHGRWVARTLAVVVSSLGFGCFHFTYWGPFPSLDFVIMLSVVWVCVSLVYLLSRSLVAAVAFNNVMAVIGFVRNGLDLPGTPLQGLIWAGSAGATFVLVLLTVLSWQRRKVACEPGTAQGQNG